MNCQKPIYFAYRKFNIIIRDFFSVSDEYENLSELTFKYYKFSFYSFQLKENQYDY